MVVFNAIYNVIGYQYFFATGRENKFTLFIFCGAVINVVCNAILIPYLGSLGAIIGSLAAEAVVSVIMLIYIRKLLDIKQLGISMVKTVAGGLVMGVLSWNLNRLLGYGVCQSFVVIAVGTAIYLLVELILQEDFMLSLLQKLKKREV